MLKIAVLCSGGLGFDTLKKIMPEYHILCVLTDSNSKTIIEFAKTNDIPLFSGNPRKKKGFEFIKAFDIDVIASINYLFLIEEDIINHSKQLTFNIHGSLLPKYRGRTPHVWAIINDEKEAGITAHVIDAGCDTGKIIHQIKVPIEDEDTGADMLNKYADEYFPMVKQVLHNLEYNQLDLKIQNDSFATYFGKRTSEDGAINWNWTKEKIRNWIRAQAHPYPGAFTFYDGEKIIIDKVSFTDELISKKQLNGQIISKINLTPIIKTSNGAIKLDTIRTENCIFELGKAFDNENRK
ncbi:methionyl-tRNA formyltransferase [Psychroserpens burtonensis]|uniref:Methionyl-tRNA formyltransferase n=1 Tax=Psychroserpens burtonensis TaxID=49278 RepID=A0A5C7BJ06_9FLAO|nr:methionyl-tRNA formyltransferase [Psychroserpens burtonensis]TXE19090.1 methionyl-tRNA formyltransferase [Psychroserpens burtonensis]